jgi:F-type H+-transporting ATPase subunit b
MNRCRLVLAALLIAVATIVVPFGGTQGPVVPLSAAPQQAEPAAAPQHTAPPGAEASETEAAHDSWAPVIAKAVNFALLVAVLVYFLRSPIMTYLDSRIGKVREDLVTAAQTRETAVRQLAQIDAKLAALPGELEALKRRGAEDLLAERARIAQEAEAERRRLLEHTRREIEMRLRLAKRELLELTANLAVKIASERIKASITAQDQARLVDRYAAQIGQAGAGRSPGEARS